MQFSMAKLSCICGALLLANATAVAESPKDYAYVAFEVTGKRVRLQQYDTVHVQLFGEAAKKYATITGQEVSDEEMMVTLRCTIEDPLDNGRLRITSRSILGHRTELDENSRMVSFSAIIDSADLVGGLASVGAKSTPQAKFRSADGVTMRLWKLVE